MNRRGALAASFLAISFAACGANEALPTGPVESGFVLGRDGFAFANFSGPDLDARLTPEAIARMFGDDGTCARRRDGACEPTELASLWADHVNRAMLGGRCEGFAVLSALMFLGDVPAATFGSDAPSSLVLADNRALAGELAYWFSSQFLRSVAHEQTRALSGREAVQFLSRTLDDHGDLYRIGIVRIDDQGRRRGGHAVLPYAVAPADDGTYAIYVYDNNHPGALRSIVVDTERDAWSYRAATSPEDPEGLYEGDATNGNRLYFAPVRPRLGAQACPYCSGEATATGAEFAQLFTFGSAEIAVVDGAGRSSGILDGRVVTEVPDVMVAPSFSDAWADDASATLFTPMTGTVRVVTRVRRGDAPSGVRILGRGYGAGAEGVGDQDRVVFGRGGSVVFEPSAARRARVFSVRRVSPKSELRVAIEPEAPTDATFGLSIDEADGKARVDGGVAGATFELTITRTTDAATDPFRGTVSVPPGGVVTLDTGGWSGPGTPIEGTLTIDGGPELAIAIADENATLPRSCRDALASDPSAADGPRFVDPDGPGGLAPFQVYCDFATDGGGWTILAAHAGSAGGVPVTSDAEVPGDPLAFAHYNLNRARKIALSTISTESLFRRPEAWLKANAPLLDSALLAPGSHPHVPVLLTVSSGDSMSAFMGYATTGIELGGDFGIAEIAFDHATPGAAHVNGRCASHLLYSYASAGFSGYGVTYPIGAWRGSDEGCGETSVPVYFAVR